MFAPTGGATSAPYPFMRRATSIVLLRYFLSLSTASVTTALDSRSRLINLSPFLNGRIDRLAIDAEIGGEFIRGHEIFIGCCFYFRHLRAPDSPPRSCHIRAPRRWRRYRN